MSITLTINAATPGELQSTLAALVGSAQPAAKTEAKPAAAAKPATTAQVKAAIEAQPIEASAEENPAPTPEADATGEVSDADLKTAAVSYQQKNGRDALAAALKDHGAPAGVTSIPAERRADFVAFCSAE